jgi:hypothetical protein
LIITKQNRELRKSAAKAFATLSIFLKQSAFLLSLRKIVSIMTLIIDKSNLKNTAKILNEKLKKSGKKGNLTKHFGKLKRNIDGLSYQISIRENED